VNSLPWEHVCLWRHYSVMAAYVCLLRICCLAADAVSLSVSRSLPRNGVSTCYDIFTPVFYALNVMLKKSICIQTITGWFHGVATEYPVSVLSCYLKRYVQSSRLHADWAIRPQFEAPTHNYVISIDRTSHRHGSTLCNKCTPTAAVLSLRSLDLIRKEGVYWSYNRRKHPHAQRQHNTR
jgi:hypothetical protein